MTKLFKCHLIAQNKLIKLIFALDEERLSNCQIGSKYFSYCCYDKLPVVKNKILDQNILRKYDSYISENKSI